MHSIRMNEYGQKYHFSHIKEKPLEPNENLSEQPINSVLLNIHIRIYQHEKRLSAPQWRHFPTLRRWMIKGFHSLVGNNQDSGLTLCDEEVHERDHGGVATEHIVSTRPDPLQGHSKALPDHQGTFNLRPYITIHLEERETHTLHIKIKWRLLSRSCFLFFNSLSK